VFFIVGRSYAEWGVDYLKLDYCGMEKHQEGPEEMYTRMRDALQRATQITGRPILFSICNWGGSAPHRWGPAVGNSWRTGRDVFAVWDHATAQDLRLPGYIQSVMEAMDGQKMLARYAGPGAFNDPDMLVVGLDGMYPYGIVEECPPTVPDCTPGEYISRERWGMVGGLSTGEQRAHFSLWVVMAAPLLLGNDPRRMAEETVAMLANADAIRVSQDPLGVQGFVTHENPRASTEVWCKPLQREGHAVLLLNRSRRPAAVRAVWGRDTLDGCQARLGVDTAPCPGEDPACEPWASSGECGKNPAFMLTSCKCSCEALLPLAGQASSTGEGEEGGPGWPRQQDGGVLSAWVKDVWAEEELGWHEGGFVATVQPHDVKLLLVTAKGPSSAVSGPDEAGKGPLSAQRQPAEAAAPLSLRPSQLPFLVWVLFPVAFNVCLVVMVMRWWRSAGASAPTGKKGQLPSRRQWVTL